MSLSADAILLLASKGLSIAEIAEVARANVEAPPVETKDDRARRLAAERKQRQRERHAESVTKRDISVTSEADDQSRQSVTKRDNVTESHAAPRARVEDNLLTTDTEPNLTTLNFDAPDRVTLDYLAGELERFGGLAMASKAIAPRLFDLSPILGLLKSGQGPPCDLWADVLPALQQAAAKAPKGSIKSWGYFVSRITEARDRRLQGAPATVTRLEPRHDQSAGPRSAKRASREDNHARALAGAQAAAAARAAVA